MSMEKVRIHYIFHGTVQGVGFRYKACYSAKNRGVTGWVRNCSDGTVEMEAEGYPADMTIANHFCKGNFKGHSRRYT